MLEVPTGTGTTLMEYSLTTPIKIIYAISFNLAIPLLIFFLQIYPQTCKLIKVQCASLFSAEVCNNKTLGKVCINGGLIKKVLVYPSNTVLY